MDHYTLKDLPTMERPYEKCLEKGPEVLSDAELLAVILRTGTKGATSVELAREILSQSGCGGLVGLIQMKIPQLCKVRGVGKVKAVQIKCIAELSRRIAKTALHGETLCFDDPSVIAKYYMEDFRHMDQEHVMALMLDSKCHLLHEEVIAKGTVNQAPVTPREIFRIALSFQAVFVILLHNHPSGDVTPSGSDDQLTKRVAQAGNLVGIPLVDHIILGDRNYFSYKEKGLL